MDFLILKEVLDIGGIFIIVNKKQIQYSEERIKRRDIILKGLIIFIVIWISGMEVINYKHLREISVNQKNIKQTVGVIQQDIIDIKVRALESLNEQDMINIGVKSRLDEPEK